MSDKGIKASVTASELVRLALESTRPPSPQPLSERLAQIITKPPPKKKGK